MANQATLRCDGCGQTASAEHIAKRLQRLEWATRYRPIHVGTLFLGASAPERDSEFPYAGGGDFEGEGKSLLEAAGIGLEGKSAEAILGEFQRGGFLLAYVLDCPIESSGADLAALSNLLEQRLPFAITRIRRSLKPKRLALISRALNPLIGQLESVKLECSLLLKEGQAFALDAEPTSAAARLREALALAASPR
jgi:hypothetical protein